MPWFVAVMLTATGPLLVVLGLPLVRRQVRPNVYYGVRTRDTLADEAVWYEVNAMGGRDLIVLGTLFVVVLSVVQLTGNGWPEEFRILVPVGVLLLGLAFSTGRLVRAAKRMRRERGYRVSRGQTRPESDRR